jgi:hypothetical protein
MILDNVPNREMGHSEELVNQSVSEGYNVGIIGYPKHYAWSGSCQQINRLADVYELPLDSRTQHRISLVLGKRSRSNEFFD